MSDPQTKGGFTGDPAAALTVTGSSGCCGNGPQTTDFLATPASADRSSPCCGTNADAQASGSCCGSAAKAEAVAAGKAAADDHAHSGRRRPDGRHRRDAGRGPVRGAGRVGTAGGAAARTWLGGRLADLGAEVSFTPFPVRSVPDVYATPMVRWHDGRTVRELDFGRDVAMHLASAETPLLRTAGLVVAGGGDPTGRWVLVPEGISLFDAYGHADGALGLLLARGVDGAGWQYTMLAGPDPGHLPVLTLATPVFDLVATRAAWFAGNAPVRRVDVTAASVHGRFRDAADGGVDLLLTAHYDGVGDLPGIRQPGAADNGSGVAVVLEAARLLAAHLPDGVGLSVALLDAEEVGALGSAHHAATLDTRPLVVNVDGAS